MPRKSTPDPFAVSYTGPRKKPLLAELHQQPATNVLRHEPLWQDFAHAVFNLKEFIYVQ